MCLCCVVNCVQRFVNTLNSHDDEANIEEQFKSLVYCLEQAARFDHSDNRFPWAKAVAVLAPQMTSECRASGEFEAPPQRRMLEYSRNALIRLTSVQYKKSEADQERMLVEALQQVKDALKSLDESES
jgi:hypothetical protein